MTTSPTLVSYREALSRLTVNPRDTEAMKICAAALLCAGQPQVASVYLQLLGDKAVEVPASWCLDTSNPEMLSTPEPQDSKSDLVRLANIAMLTRNGNVLEIGCGTGKLSAMLSAFGNEVYGVALQPIDADLARFRFYELGLTCGHFRASTLHELSCLPDSDSSFDFVVLVDLLQKIPNPEDVLREAARVVKPGGLVIISVPNAYCKPLPDQVRLFTRHSLFDLVSRTMDGSFAWIDTENPISLSAAVQVDKATATYNSPDPNLYLTPWPVPEIEKPLVSIIVPTYNRAHLLPRSIESLLAQTYRPIEIIVVDDGSTDNTREVVEPYLNRIQYVGQENSGCPTARNTGILRSKGKYILFFDDDDISLPRLLEVEVRQLESSGAAFCHGSAVVVDDDFRISRVHVARNVSRNDLLEYEFLVGNVFFGGTGLISRAALDKVGLYDTRLIRAQDYDMWMRLLARFEAVSVDYLGQIYFFHQGQRGSADDRFSASNILNKTREYEKIIFRKLYNEIPLEAVFPDIEKYGSPIVRIEALLRRAQSLNMRGLEDLAKRDIEVAGRLAEGLRLALSPKAQAAIDYLTREVPKWPSPQAALSACRALKKVVDAGMDEFAAYGNASEFTAGN